MRPGAFSQSGFLGPEERLDEVMLHDDRIMSKLKVTYGELARRLEELIIVGERSPGHNVRVKERFEVLVIVYKGFQICPWSPYPDRAQCLAGEGANHASVVWKVRNLRSGQAMRGPGLIVHLIRDHHFFEGLESPERVDPELLSRLLELR